jgi:hypothetical protein
MTQSSGKRTNDWLRPQLSLARAVGYLNGKLTEGWLNPHYSLVPVVRDLKFARGVLLKLFLSKNLHFFLVNLQGCKICIIVMQTAFHNQLTPTSSAIYVFNGAPVDLVEKHYARCTIFCLLKESFYLFLTFS